MVRLTSLFVVVGLLASCSPGGGGGGPRRDGGGLDAASDGAFGPENTMATCFDGIDNDGDGDTDCVDAGCLRFPGCMSPTDGGPGTDGFTECTGIDVMADNAFAPVDIIWVVDSSGSMENDASVVQMNLDGFAADIEARAIDFHVVMISDRGFVTPSPRFDTDPRFLFVDRGVGSNEAFDRTLDQFPAYMAHLRPTAITHVIGVTDDDEDMAAATFKSMMTALLGHEFTYHAIASPPGECPLCPIVGCSSICDFGCQRPGGLVPAAAEGTQHWAAAAIPPVGRTFSICTSDWSGLFDTLAATVAVSTELPCVYEIPDPPAGMTFDRSLVNVKYTPDGGTARTFPGSGTEAMCGSEEAWYYDDPAAPTSIILCPAACDAVTSGGGTVQVQLGCGTVLI